MAQSRPISAPLIVLKRKEMPLNPVTGPPLHDRSPWLLSGAWVAASNDSKMRVWQVPFGEGREEKARYPTPTCQYTRPASTGWATETDVPRVRGPAIDRSRSADEHRKCVPCQVLARGHFDAMNFSYGLKPHAGRVDEDAKDTVKKICVEEVHVTSWSDILPHILVKQLMIDNTKKIQQWGAALVVNREGDSETAMAVRIACLPPMLDLLYRSGHEQVGYFFIYPKKSLAFLQ